MKKILFVIVLGFLAGTVLAQQPATKKKVVKAEANKSAEVQSKKAVEVKVEEAKPATQPQLITNALEAPAVSQAAPAQVDVNKIFAFTNDNYDFGKIVAGKAAEYTLTIKNISKEEATLTLVQPTCGCTTPKYEAGKKFAPGEEVKVILGFNGGSPGQSQTFNKTVTITLNGNLTKSVSFKGETYPAPAESAPTNGGLEKLKPGN
jgi:hypothetical protein